MAEILTIDEMQEMASDGAAAIEDSKESGSPNEVGRAAAGIIASGWIMASQLAARLDLILKELEKQTAADELPDRPGVVQPDARDPAADAGYDKSGSGGAAGRGEG